MRQWLRLATIIQVIWLTQSTEKFVPCSEVSRDLRFPCRCSVGKAEPQLDGNPAVSVDCDRVVFTGDFPAIPFGAPIISFKQRWVGHQALPTQIFSRSALPLRTVDFSGNSLRRLTERLLQGLQSTLLELRLADNLFGDTLNPIFSTSEFRGLKNLQLLDLSGNGIKAIEEGIFEGCNSLQELLLDRNSFSSIPSSSLNGPTSLKWLSLTGNRIHTIKQGTFVTLQSLQHLDLTNNLISTIEGGSFEGLRKLTSLLLTHNKLTKFNSDIFHGADNLKELNLAENFITEFPSVALKAFSELGTLNLSSNLIQNIDNGHLTSLTSLQQLDLSRNSIANIAPATFLGLKQLRLLDISVNSLRTIEDDAFEGLDNLETLLLQDNNILLIPASAVGRLPRLSALYLDYNRVAALSGDILRSIAEQVSSLSLSRNVVRELPPATFQYFQQLNHLDLARNLITVLNSNAFSGLENTLKSLKLARNRLSSIVGSPLALTNLEALDLSGNQLKELSKNVFTLLPNLKYLNLSYNSHLSTVPAIMLQKLGSLEVLDMSYTGLKTVSPDLVTRSSKLMHIYLQNNEIGELPENTFANLTNLTSLDLSYNKIVNIRRAFVNVMNIKELSLKGNQLNSFKGEFFNTGTGLEVLDISDNQLSYLFPSSFRIHPRLRKINAAGNKFNYFPAELIATLQFLESVDLSRNGLKAVEELDFARLPRLRTLLLADNELDSVSEMAFHNSTQLQVLDLSGNKLERLGERTLEGLIRLESLNLESNLLTDLPETIFERSKLQMLENINLARNLFETAPLKALQRQYFFLYSVDLSRNKLTDIPADDSILVNIKKLDLSYNRLSNDAINNVLGEPKTVRELNLAHTGMTQVPQLETPFLYKLNLSHNNISSLDEAVFERSTLLENLDLSHNKLPDVSASFPKLLSLLKNIQKLNLSSNPIAMISNKDFEGLESLRVLSLHDLNECIRIDKNAFKSLPNLSVLDAYNYPKLGYLDIQGLLQNLPSLERVNIETKDPAVGSDQFQTVLHPRLLELGIRGSRLHSISSGTLSGIKGSNVIIRLRNTSITTLPPALFFPAPRSSRIILDVTGSQLTTILPQMLSALEDRRGDLKIVGLETNPIVCDCGARALRRWLPSHMNTIRCATPDHLYGRLLVEVGDDELTCDAHKAVPTSTVSSTVPQSRATRLIPKTTEPEIIWSIASTEKLVPKITAKPPNVSAAIGNDDTLIIGIVGGVVAFIAILIIIICIIRLRMTQNQYRGGPLANGTTPVMPTPSSCACSSVKGGTQLYALPPYGGGYAATLPHKMNGTAGPPQMRSYSTMGRNPYYQNYSQPYFVTYPADEKVYR